MTAMQTTLFRSVLRALVSTFPNPTLETFRDLLTNGYEKYKEHIEKLPPDLKDFFYKDFNEKNYADRRREVLQRLRLLLDNETMRAMLTATSTRFRIGEAMDSGKIVIINNSKARLGDQGAEFFGRFFIAQVLAAAQQRSSRRRERKPPVYFYIDECQNVIARDEKIPTILDECRSQNIALIMAHQRTKQITTENVLDALSNCAIRFANSDEEARFLAPRLRTSPEFLQQLGRGRFAAFIRDLTPGAVAVSVNRVDFAQHQALSAAESNRLADRMRAEYGTPREIAPPPPSAPNPAQPSPSNAPATSSGEEPILNLHHPDLPWRLEDPPTPKTEQTRPEPTAQRDPTPPNTDENLRAQLTHAYRLLAGVTKRGEWEKVAALRASIDELEQRLGMSPVTDAASAPSDKTAEPADTPPEPPPPKPRPPSGTSRKRKKTEGASEWY